MRLSIVTTLLALVTVIAPATADARRAAGPVERAELAALLNLPPECVNATVSTVDLRFGQAKTNGAPGCTPGDGFVVGRRVNGVWVDVYQASDPTAACPREVSVAAGRDLSVCRKPRSYLGCAVSDDDGLSAGKGYRPSNCDLLAFRGTGLVLRRMRWWAWGTRTVRGRGYTIGRQRILVQPYRKVRQADNDFCYSRVKYSGRFGGGRMRVACPHNYP